MREQNVEVMKRCIELDIDCAQTCAFAAAAMARDSQLARKVCSVRRCVSNAGPNVPSTRRSITTIARVLTPLPYEGITRR